jgi:cytosine/adenosine deaminase-related metal-dependent hydrolase
MTKTTLIKDCDWVVAWDAKAGRHHYLRHADVAFSGNRLVHVGAGFAGKADETVAGKGLMAMPGLIDIHSHPSLEPFYRGVREEHGTPTLYMTGLFERSVAFWPEVADQYAATEVAYCEMLLSGVTTVCDLSFAFEGWIELVARSGLRGYVAPWYASARWKLENAWELKYEWNEAGGKKGLREAVALIDEALRHPSGRVSGALFPGQIDTCTAELLRDSVAAARERNVPVTTHVSQAVSEFQEMVRRHGKTPMQWAHEIGILCPNMTLAHCVFVDDHSWNHWRTRRDVALLAETGTTLAHCPTPFARYGAALEDFGRFRRAGVKLGIGTDTTPHNFIEEMRWALILCKIASGDVFGTSLGEVLHAATIGGADALMREDIGRLAPGAKADLVLVDLEDPMMIPARDPLRSLVFHAADRAVRDVYVDGQLTVKNRKVLTIDREAALAKLKEGQARMLSKTPQRDFARRSADQVAPLTLPVAG